jgi:hypothetical protein
LQVYDVHGRKPEVSVQKPGQPSTEKQPYEKPEVRKISLAAGEVAAAGCKSMGSMGPGGSSCSNTMCSAIGS